MTESVQPKTTTEQPTPTFFRPSNLALWLIVAAILGLMGWGLTRTNAPRPEAGQPAPGFGMQFFNGYEWENRPTADLSEMEGKVVVINFWASWCVECRLEADLLEAASRQYADDVVFLGIAWADAEPNSLAYLDEFNITYPNAPDLGQNVAQDYEITGVPETFFIDRDGTIAHVTIGPVDEATMSGVLGQLVGQVSSGQDG